MSEKQAGTTARDGWITFALSLALWGGLLGGVLYFGHHLANIIHH